MIKKIGGNEMTSKEAKSILNEYRNRNYSSTFRDELELAKAIDTILPSYVELESRYTPMKPLIDELDVEDEHRCPVCERVVWEFHVHRDENFCNNCGQKLDWSDER